MKRKIWGWWRWRPPQTATRLHGNCFFHHERAVQQSFWDWLDTWSHLLPSLSYPNNLSTTQPLSQPSLFLFSPWRMFSCDADDAFPIAEARHGVKCRIALPQWEWEIQGQRWWCLWWGLQAQAEIRSNGSLRGRNNWDWPHKVRWGVFNFECLPEGQVTNWILQGQRGQYYWHREWGRKRKSVATASFQGRCCWWQRMHWSSTVMMRNWSFSCRACGDLATRIRTIRKWHLWSMPCFIIIN